MDDLFASSVGRPGVGIHQLNPAASFEIVRHGSFRPFVGNMQPVQEGMAHSCGSASGMGIAGYPLRFPISHFPGATCTGGRRSASCGVRPGGEAIVRSGARHATPLVQFGRQRSECSSTSDVCLLSRQFPRGSAPTHLVALPTVLLPKPHPAGHIAKAMDQAALILVKNSPTFGSNSRDIHNTIRHTTPRPFNHYMERSAARQNCRSFYNQLSGFPRRPRRRRGAADHLRR